VTRLVLLGGGHAHALVLLKLRDFVSKNLDVVLVNEGPIHTYSGMVPGVIAGHYASADAQIDLARLARGASAQFIQGRVQQIDPAEKKVVLESGATLDYNVLSLNLGSVPAGLPAHAIAAKPFEGFLARWRELRINCPKAPRIAVVGAGAGGVELAMAMRFALRGQGEVVLFSDRQGFPQAVWERVHPVLARLGIGLRAGAPDDFDATFWVTGPAALPLLKASGLKTDDKGYVLVDASLRSVSHPDIFAAGDNASLEGANLPKSGVYAVRQGAVLAENLKRVVRGMPMLDYAPRKSSLSLISCGAKYAIASRGRWHAEGGWVWWWKNWLDRRWVAQFR